MTSTVLRSAVMSASGSPSTATRSAWRPGAIAPIWSFIRSDSAESDVSETIASIGFWPPSLTLTTASSMLRPCAPATASVP